MGQNVRRSRNYSNWRVQVTLSFPSRSISVFWSHAQCPILRRHSFHKALLITGMKQLSGTGSPLPCWPWEALGALQKGILQNLLLFSLATLQCRKQFSSASDPEGALCPQPWILPSSYGISSHPATFVSLFAQGEATTWAVFPCFKSPIDLVASLLPLMCHNDIFPL